MALGFDSITKKRLLEIRPYNAHPIVEIDTALLKMMAASLKKEVKKKDKKSFDIDNYGVAIQSLFSREPGIKSYGGGIGLFATKNIYRNKLFLNVEFLFSKVFGSTDTKSIDGYYITPDAVLLYKPSNVNTQQLDFPITISWKFRKVKPQIGVAYTQKKTGLDFFAYRNNIVINTIQRTSYQLTNNYIDFVYGIEYDISKRVGLFLKSKQTLVKITNNKTPENLKSLEELHFFPNQVIFGVTYNLKKQ